MNANRKSIAPEGTGVTGKSTCPAWTPARGHIHPKRGMLWAILATGRNNLKPKTRPMKNIRSKLAPLVPVALLALLSTLNSQLSTLFAQGTAFTYQGRLNAGGNPANGSYDLSFSLYSVSSGGSVTYGPLTNSATAVSNGLFTVMLDFGIVFGGNTYWLDISTRTNGNGSFTELSPRQQLTPVPYAEHAETAGSASLAYNVADYSVNALSFAVNGGSPAPGDVLGMNSGNGLAWLAPSSTSSGWSLTGNGGTTPGTDFLGTRDNQ